MKLNLLKTSADFGRMRKARSYQSANFRIKVLSPLNQNLPRFGFIVPKKILPKVTNRNKVKRRLKTVLNKSLLRIKSSDVLIFPSSRVLRLKFVDLESEITQLFKKAGLWKF